MKNKTRYAYSPFNLQAFNMPEEEDYLEAEENDSKKRKIIKLLHIIKSDIDRIENDIKNEDDKIALADSFARLDIEIRSLWKD